MRSTFCQTTIDPVFRYLMSNSVVRNGLLSAILRKPIFESELQDVSLNPLPAYRELRELFNRKDIQELMETLSDTDRVNLVNRDQPSLVNQAMSFMWQLALRYFELSAALPDAERQTQLDMVCKTDYGWVEIEMQIAPQNFWDLRILDHVCGLFHRQFGRGFKWSSLEKDRRLSQDIRRVVGVSIFEKPPIFPEQVQSIFPWYEVQPWGKEELRRHYRLCDTENPSLKRPGLEFFDFNLEAYLILHAKHLLEDYPKDLCEWLEFFAAAHTKTEREVLESNYSAEVQEAYRLVKTLPPDVEELYEESLLRQANISHYVAGVRDEGKVEGRAEGRIEAETQFLAEKKAMAERLRARGLSIDEIASITCLSSTEIEP